MQYLLSEEEFAEYQALKSEESEPLEEDVTVSEDDKFFTKLISICKVETYNKPQEFNKQYLAFEVPLDIIPEGIMSVLRRRLPLVSSKT